MNPPIFVWARLSVDVAWVLVEQPISLIQFASIVIGLNSLMLTLKGGLALKLWYTK